MSATITLGFFWSICHLHISLQCTLFTPSPSPPPPHSPPQKQNWFQFLLGITVLPRESENNSCANREGKTEFNNSWNSNSICSSSVCIGELPISSKQLLSHKLGDSPYQTSLLRANHYITPGHSCTIRKVAFVLVSRLKRLWKGGRGLSLQLAFSLLLFPLSATRKNRKPVHLKSLLLFKTR